MSGTTLVSAGAAATHAASPQRSHRSSRERLRLVSGVAFTLAVLGAAWWPLAPPQLGGSTSFVVVDGTSMLPHLHRSDLVALRPSARPRVGDIVGYRSVMLHRVVLHRIAAIEGDHYVFKGDNNSFTDPEQPRRSDLVGKLWFQIPLAGRAIGVLHVPWILAALAALLVLAIGLDGAGTRSRDDHGGAIQR